MSNTVTAHVGDLKTLTFQANPSTGYQWVTGIVPSQLLVHRLPFQQDASCTPQMVGCGGTISFQVIVTPSASVGSSYQVNFYYVRGIPNYQEIVPTQTYTFNIAQ